MRDLLKDARDIYIALRDDDPKVPDIMEDILSSPDRAGTAITLLCCALNGLAEATADEFGVDGQAAAVNALSIPPGVVFPEEN